MPESKRKPHEEDVDSEEEELMEEEVVPEFTEDVSHLTPSSIEVISNQVRVLSLGLFRTTYFSLTSRQQ